jgi:hypothetical protein
VRGLASLLVETDGEWLDIASLMKQRDVDGARRFLRIGNPVAWKHTGPFMAGRKSGEVDDTKIAAFPDFREIIKANNQGVFPARTFVFNKLASAVHRSMQNVFRRFINFIRVAGTPARGVPRRFAMRATVDRAVEIKVNFCSAYLKGGLGKTRRLIDLGGKSIRDKLANRAAYDRPLSLRRKS